jgi:hypothetical protein
MTLGALSLIALIVLVLVFIRGSDDFLYEKSSIWFFISSANLVISVTSFIVGYRLIQNDPRFKAIEFSDVKLKIGEILKTK